MSWIEWARVFGEGYLAGIVATVLVLALARRAH